MFDCGINLDILHSVSFYYFYYFFHDSYTNTIPNSACVAWSCFFQLALLVFVIFLMDLIYTVLMWYFIMFFMMLITDIFLEYNL